MSVSTQDDDFVLDEGGYDRPLHRQDVGQEWLNFLSNALQAEISDSELRALFWVTVVSGGRPDVHIDPQALQAGIGRKDSTVSQTLQHLAAAGWVNRRTGVSGRGRPVFNYASKLRLPT